MSYAVIIPSKTASNLAPCITAVRKHEPDARIIIVDDGIDWAEVERGLKPGTLHCDFEVIAGRKPFIFARNVNIGIKHAGDVDVVLLNDDALLETPGGFTALMKVAEAHPEFGVISAVTNCAGNPRQYPRGVGLRSEFDTVAFICVYIPRSVIEKVGLLDERFDTYGWEDNDYCHRVRLAGLGVGIYDGCFVDHRSLHSAFRGAPGAPGEIESGRRKFREKWGLA